MAREIHGREIHGRDREVEIQNLQKLAAGSIFDPGLGPGFKLWGCHGRKGIVRQRSAEGWGREVRSGEAWRPREIGRSAGTREEGGGQENFRKESQA
jgi:hypothetical protein